MADEPTSDPAPPPGEPQPAERPGGLDQAVLDAHAEVERAMAEAEAAVVAAVNGVAQLAAPGGAGEVH